MEIIDFTVVNFHVFPDAREPRIRALAQIKIKGVEKIQVAWVELDREEWDNIFTTSRMIEQRFLSGHAQLPPEVEGPDG